MPSSGILVVVEDIYYLFVIRQSEFVGWDFLKTRWMCELKNSQEAVGSLTSPKSSAGSLRFAIISDEVHSRC